ncbi:MAG TPA: zinc-ribbon domain-containing protein [Pirellulales bacterium]|nr:zinc-ribbon domain-containing protein [Pirellulales bacterium]
MAKRRIPRYRRNADETEAERRARIGRIAADLSQQASNNSFSPLLFYEDTPFACIDCGKEEIWTAEQQQWWYEVAKGSIYSRAKRCRDCRRKHRARREAGVPPDQPVRTAGELMKIIRIEIEPALCAAGFLFESRNRQYHPGERVWLDYVGRGRTFSFSFDPRLAQLKAELLSPDGDVLTVAAIKFQMPRTTADVMETVNEFTSAVIAFLADIPADS